jgi:hypothetical protein
MPRPALAALALAGSALLPLAGCTFEHRTDGGSPLHTDNGAVAAHRQSVEEALTPEVVEPLDGAVATTGGGAPVPTPRLGTAAQGEAAAPNSGALATPPAQTTTGGRAPAGTTTGNTAPAGQ